MNLSVRSCSRCGATHDRVGQRYCHDCHAAAQRKHRAATREKGERAVEQAVAKNQFEAAAREKKVHAFVAFLWNVLTPENRIDPETVSVLRRINQESWDMIAKDAGLRSPSEATQRRVIEILTQRVKDARWGWHRGSAA